MDKKLSSLEIRPSLGSMFAYGVNGVNPSSNQNAEFWNSMMGSNFLTLLSPSKLPHDWRSYNQHDVVMISHTLVETLAIQDAAALDAIRDFMMFGGVMVVYECTDSDAAFASLGVAPAVDETAVRSIAALHAQISAERFTSLANSRDRLAAIDAHLEKLKMLDQADAKAMQEYLDSNSTGGSMGYSDPPSRNVQIYQNTEFWFAETIEESNVERQTIRDQIKLDQKLISRQRDAEELGITKQTVAAGLVITTTAKLDDYDAIDQWDIVRGLFGSRISPTLRRGVDPMMGDERFSRWTIAGVAQPPVYTFIGLLTVFVILVGPVAYRKTSKAGRGYLMFAIAPVLALVTTAAMFAYGIISDGFGTIARVRQVTFVDGVSGDAVERVRASYFAGVRPSDGIRFGPETEVMPYWQNNMTSWRMALNGRPADIGRIVIDDNSQRFDANFLPSREQTQFVTHRPRHDIGSLAIASDGETITFVSGFDFPMTVVVARDMDGDYHVAMDVRPNASTVAETMAETVATKIASRLLGKMYGDDRPIGATSQSRSRRNRTAYGYNEIYDVILEINRNVKDTSGFTDGLFEFQLQQQLQSSGELPVGHFAAVTAISPDTLAVANARPVDSIRYVCGSLAPESKPADLKPADFKKKADETP
jgi:hypothetical protein